MAAGTVLGRADLQAEDLAVALGVDRDRDRELRVDVHGAAVPLKNSDRGRWRASWRIIACCSRSSTHSLGGCSP